MQLLVDSSASGSSEAARDDRTGTAGSATQLPVLPKPTPHHVIENQRSRPFAPMLGDVNLHAVVVGEDERLRGCHSYPIEANTVPLQRPIPDPPRCNFHRAATGRRDGCFAPPLETFVRYHAGPESRHTFRLLRFLATSRSWPLKKSFRLRDAMPVVLFCTNGGSSMGLRPFEFVDLGTYSHCPSFPIVSQIKMSGSRILPELSLGKIASAWRISRTHREGGCHGCATLGSDESQRFSDLS